MEDWAEIRRSLSEADYADLIAAAHHQLNAPVILVWDNLNTHLGTTMRTFTQAHPDWLTVARVRPVGPRNPSMSAGRYWMRLSRFLMTAAS